MKQKNHYDKQKHISCILLDLYCFNLYCLAELWLSRLSLWLLWLSERSVTWDVNDDGKTAQQEQSHVSSSSNSSGGGGSSSGIGSVKLSASLTGKRRTRLPARKEPEPLEQNVSTTSTGPSLTNANAASSSFVDPPKKTKVSFSWRSTSLNQPTISVNGG